MSNVIILGLGEVGDSVLGLYVEKGNVPKLEYNILPIDTDVDKIHASYTRITPYNNLYPIKHDITCNTCNDMIDKASITSYDVMHVCIPFIDGFNQIVIDAINEYDPKITIIHSTVNIGTTETIETESGHDVVHSPVMGVHPNLTESMKAFNKIIGYNKQIAYDNASDHLRELGCSLVPYSESRNSEAAKFFSTSYYGLCIVFMKEVQEYCEENNLDFDQVYGITNTIYNDGYESMRKANVKRPILVPMEGEIGGHCVVPNWNIIKGKFKLAEQCIEYNDKYKAKAEAKIKAQDDGVVVGKAK